jgi:hypothetical protein
VIILGGKNMSYKKNKTVEELDPNYIYPMPYIDPMMCFNPYAMNPFANPYMNNESQNRSSNEDNMFNRQNMMFMPMMFPAMMPMPFAPMLPNLEAIQAEEDDEEEM